MLISYFFAHASITVHARWSMVYTDHDFELPYPFFSPRVTGAAHRRTNSTFLQFQHD